MLAPPPPPPAPNPRGTAKPEAVRANTPAPALLSLSMSLRVSWMLFGLAIVSPQFAQLSASPPNGLGGAVIDMRGGAYRRARRSWPWGALHSSGAVRE